MLQLAKLRIYVLAITLGTVVTLTSIILSQQQAPEQGKTTFKENRELAEEENNMRYAKGEVRVALTLLDPAGKAALATLDANTTNNTATKISSNITSNDAEKNSSAPSQENKSGISIERRPLISASCGQVLTENAILSNDLECPGTGLIVKQDGITIQLNSHRLSLTNSSVSATRIPELENVGILVADRRNITIVGPGIITGFDKAIEFAGSNSGYISDIKFLKNKVGILIKASDEITIYSTSIEGNAVGIATQSSKRGNIVFNQILQNAQQGIVVLDSNYFTLTGNSVFNNGENGVFLDVHSSNNTLSSNNLLNQTIDINNADGVPIDIAANKFIENTCRKTLPDGLC
ncbi:MAG: right-handed parallel beta-helix repeat-containing protein [Thermoproteota archaeon]